MLMADSSTRFSSISIFPVSERRRKWIAKESGVRYPRPGADFARLRRPGRIPCRVCDVGQCAAGNFLIRFNARCFSMSFQTDFLDSKSLAQLSPSLHSA
jgi:hypothetical protein